MNTGAMQTNANWRFSLLGAILASVFLHAVVLLFASPVQVNSEVPLPRSFSASEDIDAELSMTVEPPIIYGCSGDPAPFEFNMGHMFEVEKRNAEMSPLKACHRCGLVHKRGECSRFPTVIICRFPIIKPGGQVAK
jgi:uncharacterized protein (DUF58 family)